MIVDNPVSLQSYPRINGTALVHILEAENCSTARERTTIGELIERLVQENLD